MLQTLPTSTPTEMEYSPINTYTSAKIRPLTQQTYILHVLILLTENWLNNFTVETSTNLFGQAKSDEKYSCSMIKLLPAHFLIMQYIKTPQENQTH